ncbi:MAG: flagellar basal body rod C-terminal domain-containing protein, partial [Oscillospiraceae bacterium]
LPKNAIKFGNDMNTVKISAKNISVSQKWINTQGGYITMTKESQTGDSNAPIEGSNLQYMISLLEKEFAYTAEGSNSPIFKGTFQNFFTNISTTLGIEQKEISRQYDSYGSILIDIDKQRMSVSSVDINEEVINMMKYNQSLNASSRMMTTLDEAIDVIVNKMGLVGR